MSEVAKVREALDFRASGQTRTPIERSFVAHGLKVCEDAERDAPHGSPSLYRQVGRLDLVAAILRDAGLLEEGR